jgi:hypothetical protein
MEEFVVNGRSQQISLEIVNISYGRAGRQTCHNKDCPNGILRG